MKRVLQVVGKMNIGGTENLLMNLYRNIDRSKVQFDFLTFYNSGEKGFYDDEITSLGGEIVNVHSPSIFKYNKSIKEVRDILQTKSYAVIHSHIGQNAFFALKAAKQAGVPIRVIHSHSTMPRDPSIWKRFYYRILYWLGNYYSTDFCACSQKAAEYRFSKRVLLKHCIFIPNSIDFKPILSAKKDDGFKNEFQIPKDGFVILQVGNLSRAKNQNFTIKLLEKLYQFNKKYFLLFVGRIEEYGKQLQKSIKGSEFEKNIRFLGQRGDVPRLLANSDVFVLPSLWEGLGIALLEAQATGIPCLTSDNIQPEVDLGMGNLVKRQLCIDDWIKVIWHAEKYRISDHTKIITKINQSPYTIPNLIQTINKIYGNIFE